MAKEKKSFILYSDLITVVEKLVLKDREDNTNNAGELFLHILKYVNDKEPIAINFIVDMAFEPIKLSLKRDLKKYESYIEKQRKNGAKGGRPPSKKNKPKNPTETEKTQAFILKPKKADSDSDSDSDSSFKEEPPKIIDPKHELPEDATESHFEYLKNNYSSTLYESYKRTEDFKHILKLKDLDQKTFIKRFDAKCLEQGIPYNGARIAGRLKGFTNTWVSNLKTQSKKGML